MTTNWVTRLDEAPPAGVAMAALAMTGVVGFLDFATGWEVSFSIFYLVPVGVMSWSIGRTAGIALAVLSAAGWLLADVLSGHPHSHPAIACWNAGVRLGLFLLAVFALTALKQALLYARTDALTGLPNNRAFFDDAETELARARRYQRAVTLAYLDIDGFKQVNDRLGHDKGDALLKRVAATLRRSLRNSDIIARLGGDEFVILLPETDTEAARRALQKVHDALVAEARDTNPAVGFSIGAVTWSTSPPNATLALRRADALMYAVKQNNGNAIRHETAAA